MSLTPKQIEEIEQIVKKTAGWPKKSLMLLKERLEIAEKEALSRAAAKELRESKAKNETLSGWYSWSTDWLAPRFLARRGHRAADVVAWIEETVATRGFRSPRITVHSANPVGRERMLRGIAAIEQRLSCNMNL